MNKQTPNVAAVRQFLESYQYHGKLLRGNQYARAYFGGGADGGGGAEDDPFLKAAMHPVREFVLTLPDCREKMFLYFRYLHGHSVEKCAELMEVSRRTAFRIANDALHFAAENYPPR